MSALRRCGSLTIRVTYVEDWTKGPAEYRCHVRGKNPSDRITIYVHPKSFETVARDAPQAFDEIAHAALSFASEEPSGSFVNEQADMTDSGWRIVRPSQLRKDNGVRT